MHEKTKKVLEIFSELSQIPRCSKNEDAIAQWLIDWAKKHNFAVKTDKVNNVLIKVPPTEGYENGPTIIIQGHMDMVCEKTKDSNHDFNKDPIELVYDGEWLKANKTTLGADNGIAIALAFAMASDETISHPPLELLFTVDEETGLTGANALENDFLQGKILLNVDSEDEGVFTIGCAGGRDTRIDLQLNYEKISADFTVYHLIASEMNGGHSGVDIKRQKANANKILARILNELQKRIDLRLISINGGTAHNAIPRDAEAIITLPTEKYQEATSIIEKFEKIFQAEYTTIDPNIDLSLKEIKPKTNQYLTQKDTEKVINLLMALPHGVAGMSYDIKGLVETSNNLATIRTENNVLSILSSQRGSVASLLDEHTQKLEAIAKLAGAKVESGSGYPGWKPNTQSPLLAKCKEIYKATFGAGAKVEAIHAGLECGVIGAKYPGMDMISFGATLKNAHSPDEKVHIPAIGKIWDFMAALLESYKE